MKSALFLAILFPFTLAVTSGFYLDPIWINGPEDSPVGQRLYHSIVQDSKGDLWFFGGEDKDYRTLDAETWKLEVSNNFTWVNVTTTGSIPTGRGGYQFWIVDDIIYLFGGEDNYDPVYADFYSFNISSLEWTLIGDYDPAGNWGNLGFGDSSTSPCRRTGAAAWADTTAKMLYMFAGSTEKNNLGDLWSYNISSNIWTWISGSLDPNPEGIKGDIGQASKNYSATNIWSNQAVVDKHGDVWFYSGLSSLGPSYDSSSELWRFTPSTLEWAFMGGSHGQVAPVYGTTGEYSVSNWPAPSYGGNLVYSGNDVITYFGGERAVNNSFNIALSQVWSYNITLGQWAFISGNQELVEDAPVYGVLQQSSASNKVGSRMEFGISNSVNGHVIVHGGTQDSSGDIVINSLIVLPVNLCQTEFNMCNENADCAPNGLVVTCACRTGYSGNGIGADGCTTLQTPQAQSPQSQTQPQAKTPASKTSAGGKLYVAAFFMSIVAMF